MFCAVLFLFSWFSDFYTRYKILDTRYSFNFLPAFHGHATAHTLFADNSDARWLASFRVREHHIRNMHRHLLVHDLPFAILARRAAMLFDEIDTVYKYAILFRDGERNRASCSAILTSNNYNFISFF